MIESRCESTPIVSLKEITDRVEEMAPLEEDDVPTVKPSQLIESTHDVIVTLADPNADPKAALYSAASFEDLQLRPELLKGVYAMGFQKPSKIQGKALPLLMTKP